jgi:hypothetical protein
MYATAQRVRSSNGDEAIHAFLYYHDTPGTPFPREPLDVTRDQPGRLVLRHQPGPRAGGNEVLSYIDIFAPDQPWTGSYAPSLEALTSRVATVPMIARIDDLHVIFNGTARCATGAEMRELLAAALSILEEGEARGLRLRRSAGLG